MSDLGATIAAVHDDGRERSARCPVHDDQRASLSVGRGRDGRVVLKCHAGCDTEAVLAAVGLTWRDVMTERGATTSSLGEIVAAYDHCDEHGVLIYQSVRYRQKAFRVR